MKADAASARMTPGARFFRRKMRAGKRVVAALVALAGVFLVFDPQRAVADSNGFADAVAPYEFHFPRDHGAHPEYHTEWWYFTGHLRGADGHAYGYELTMFRVGLAPGDPPRLPSQSRWHGNELYPAHFAISDLTDHRFLVSERFEREALDMAGASLDGLNVHVDGWRMWMDPSGLIHLNAGVPKYSLALTLNPQKPPVIQGQGGVSRKGPCVSCASHYYSYTRLSSSGQLRIQNRTDAVQGDSWMDHEYGSSQLEAGMAGWDWFALMLDDHRELMVYRLRRKNGVVIPESSGTLVDPSGRSLYLTRDQVHVRVTSWWRSAETQALYPSGWMLDVPDQGLHFRILPLLANQELGANNGTPPYWEGAATVEDAAGKPVGQAYVELTGYAGALEHL